MDPSERDRFLHTLRTDEVFRSAVRRELLIEELLALPETVARMAIRLDTLVDVVAAQRRDFTDLVLQMRAYMQKTIDAIGAGFAAVGPRLAEGDARLGSIDTRLEAIDGRLEAIDGRFTVVNSRFDQVDAELADIKRRIA